MMNSAEMNSALVVNQGALRAEVEAWAREQFSSLNAACARADFEAAVLEAVRGTAEWQENTSSDLCSAIGHCTLAHRVENP
jgi:hypothetical protein